MNPSSTSSSDTSDSSSSTSEYGQPALKKFLKSIGLFIIPLVIVMGAFQFWLYQYGENWTLEQIRAFESEALAAGEETLFHRIIVPEEMRRYKLGGMISRNPTFLAAGSSTSMQIRNFMFGTCSDQFYNAGGITNSIEQLSELMTVLERSPNTKFLLIGLDPWWFNPNWKEPKSVPLGELKSELRLDFEANLLVFKQLQRAFRDGGVRWKSVQVAIDALPIEGHKAIGFGGRNGDGFRGSDGSRRYGWLDARTTENRRLKDHISKTLSSIEHGRDRFEFAKAPSEQHLLKLSLFLEEASKRGVVVLGYTPPLDPKVREALLNSENHREFYTNYLAKTKAIFGATNHPFVEGDDPTRFGLGSRNMIDGFHGSELVLAHILSEFSGMERLEGSLGRCDVKAAMMAKKAVSPVSIH